LRERLHPEDDGKPLRRPAETEDAMTFIQGPIPPSGPEAISSRVVRQTTPAPAPREIAGDSVQISEIARLKAKLAAVPEIRQELVDRLRAEIETDDYDSLDKVHTAAEKLLAELKQDGIL
jgi:hypothetical protein